MANTEDAEFIGELEPSRPTGDKSLGLSKDHIHLLKNTLLNTFVGGENDGWDDKLTVGPRYLNDLPGSLNLDAYVTLDDDQTIAGGKLFAGGLAADEILDTDLDPLLTVTTDAYLVGNQGRPSALVTTDGGHAYVRAGGESAPPSPILTQANLATLAVNIIYPVGSVMLTMTAANPDTRWPDTTWVRRAQGRVLMGVGTSTDENGESYTVTNALDQHGYAGHYLTGEQIPEHTHAIKATDLKRAQTGSNEARFDAIRSDTGSGAPEDLDTDGGKAIPSVVASEPVVTVPPWEGVYIWERKS